VDGTNAWFEIHNWPPSIKPEMSWNTGPVKAKPAFQVFKDILAEATPENVSKLTDIPAKTIQRITREFAEAAQIGATIKVDGREMPYRPAALTYYRGAQGHKKGSQTNHVLKLVNMLIGNIDTPGGHIGATLDDFWVDRSHIWEGEGGMILPTPHQLHPEVPFSKAPNTAHLMDYFPLGVDPGHLIQETFFHPEKFNMPYKPDTMLICHANPLWSMPGPQEKYFEIMRQMRFIVAIDIVLNETSMWADIVLPTLDNMERWNATMIEPPNTEGMCFAQPVVKPPEGCRSEEDIFNEISERLGILENWNNVQNFVLHLDHKPELLLDTKKKYTDRDIAERKCLLWNDKPIEWYMEHGHSVTKRRPDKWYRPWEGMRLHFYIEMIVQERDRLQKLMEENDIPFRHEWEWDDYSPLPTFDLDPVHYEPKEYDLFAITYKDIQLNFSENLTIPWIADIVYRDPVHQGLLINSQTAAKHNIQEMDLVQVESPYGHIFGLARVTEAVHPEVIGVSNAVTKWIDYHQVVKPGGGNYNRLLPANIKNTDANSGQMECTARVKIKKIRTKPEDGIDSLRQYTFQKKQ
jgi:anaerobic selenocysteine-containing dehydrogenase